MTNTIKRILDCKYENGQQFYLVKWNLSWEPADKLEPLYKDSVDDFWYYINTCKNAIDGKPPPPKKRKIDEVYPATSSSVNDNNAASNTPTKFANVSLPTTPTSHQPPSVPLHAEEMNQIQAQSMPGQEIQNQSQIPLSQQEMVSSFGNAPTLFSLNSPTRGRGRGRGRGSRGRGSRGGRGGKIKQEPDVTNMISSTGLPIPQLSMPTQSFNMPAMSPGFNQIPPTAFGFDNMHDNLHSMQGDIKPTIMSDGQIMSPVPMTMDSVSMSQFSPSKPVVGMSPTSRGGRGRGRGRGGRSASQSSGIKEEKFSGEMMSPEAMNGVNKSHANNKGAPSSDDAYETWTNPYANLVLVCRQCSKEQNAKNRNSWKTHYESHLDIKNFGCYHCEKRFRMKGDLKTHITRVHKQEFVDEMVIRYNDVAPVPTVDPSESADGRTNPYVRSVYQCKVCQRELQWKSRSTWKTHYESHLDIKRFGCYVCEKQFRMKGDLKTHIVRVHKVEFIDEQVIRLEENAI